MDNIYHQYWQQELMYQLASADRCRKRAYICSPFRADTREQREKNLRTARAYMFYANKKMNMNAAAPHAYLPLLLCDEIPAERAMRFGSVWRSWSKAMLCSYAEISTATVCAAKSPRRLCFVCRLLYLTKACIWRCRNSSHKITGIRNP